MKLLKNDWNSLHGLVRFQVAVENVDEAKAVLRFAVANDFESTEVYVTDGDLEPDQVVTLWRRSSTPKSDRSEVRSLVDRWNAAQASAGSLGWSDL